MWVTLISLKNKGFSRRQVCAVYQCGEQPPFDLGEYRLTARPPRRPVEPASDVPVAVGSDVIIFIRALRQWCDKLGAGIGYPIGSGHRISVVTVPMPLPLVTAKAIRHGSFSKI